MSRRKSPARFKNPLQPLVAALNELESHGMTGEERIARVMRWVRDGFPDPSRAGPLRRAARELDDLAADLRGTPCEAAILDARQVVRARLAYSTGELESGGEGRKTDGHDVWFQFVADEIKRHRPRLALQRIGELVARICYPDADAEALWHVEERVRLALRKAR